MRIAFVLAFLAACGGKLDGSVEAGSGGDASTSVDATDSPKVKDSGTFGVDAGMVGCTPAMVMVGMGGDGCKFYASWRCGADDYAVSGGCSTLNGLSGNCQKNALVTKSITDPKCSCNDPKGLTAVGAKLCGFPPPP